MINSGKSEKLYQALSQMGVVHQQKNAAELQRNRKAFQENALERGRFEQYQKRSAQFLSALFESSNLSAEALKRLSHYSAAQLPLCSVLRERLSVLDNQQRDCTRKEAEMLSDAHALQEREDELQRRIRRIRAVKLLALDNG